LRVTQSWLGGTGNGRMWRWSLPANNQGAAPALFAMFANPASPVTIPILSELNQADGNTLKAGTFKSVATTATLARVASRSTKWMVIDMRDEDGFRLAPTSGLALLFYSFAFVTVGRAAGEVPRASSCVVIHQRPLLR
jgi:hypothetical protein